MKASGMLYKAVDVDPKPKLLQEVSSKSLQAQGFDSRRVICTYSCLRTRTHIALYVHINVYVHVRMCVYICIHYNFLCALPARTAARIAKLVLEECLSSQPTCRERL